MITSFFVKSYVVTLYMGLALAAELRGGLFDSRSLQLQQVCGGGCKKKTYYADADGDGYGNPNASVQACKPPSGYVDNSNDCDDTNPTVPVGLSPYAAQLLLLPDDQLVALASGGKKIGDYCRVAESTTGACNWYVVGRPSASTNYNGIPRTTSDQGTGCVKEDSGSFCYFNDPSYPLTPAQRAAMCTSNRVANAAAQLRYGIQNGYCTDQCRPLVGCVNDQDGSSVDMGCDKTNPICVLDDGSDPARGSAGTHCIDCKKQTYYADADGDGFGNPNVSIQACSPPRGYVDNSKDCDDTNSSVPGSLTTYAAQLLLLPDDQLVALARGGNKIGEFCRVAESTTTSCSWYVVGRPSASTSYNGIPRTTTDLGTGCVKEDTSSFCYYNDPSYPLTSSQRAAMCTSNRVANAAAQLRYGIENGYCTKECSPLNGCLNNQALKTPVDLGCDDKKPYCVLDGGVEPNLGSAGTQCTDCITTSSCIDDYLAFSDQALVNRALVSPVGKYCRVYDPSSGSCDWYVVGRSSGTYNGVPRNNADLGTGCVKDDGGSFCYYNDASYILTNAERSSMCTSNRVTNAAAQLRFGLTHGYCGDTCEPLPCP